MAAPLQLVRAGAGPPVVLVHGSAADATTWSIQLHARSPLVARFGLVAYNRRRRDCDDDWIDDTGRRAGVARVEDHAADLGAICASLGAPVVAVGSSFGAVVVLALARARPELLRAMVLCEPPLPASDDAPPVPEAFLERFDAIAAAEGGEAAGEYFLRQVLGDFAYERMPRMFQVRAKATWRAIRDDCAALGAFRVDYASLAQVRVPALLLGGERSAPSFRATLDALARALPGARREVLAGAGHMLHAEAHRAFADAVIRSCAEVGHG
jgi:pimeloyl-ACP methyl ester carboxylesterase